MAVLWLRDRGGAELAKVQTASTKISTVLEVLQAVAAIKIPCVCGTPDSGHLTIVQMTRSALQLKKLRLAGFVQEFPDV